MTYLRLLHLSDLLVDPEHLEREEWLREIMTEGVQDLVRSTFDGALFDYLVVSGNITANGKAASFEAAGLLLRDLGRRLLKEGGEDNRERILVAPGLRDADLTTPQESRWKAFREFHDGIFPGASVGPNGDWVVVREMKDLTFVGLPHLGLDAESADVLLERMAQTLKYARRRRTVFEDYMKARPTIAVGSDLILPSGGRDGASAHQKVRTEAERLGIDLHLVGRGDRALYGPEPFGLRHTVVVHRTDGENDQSHLMANVVELPHGVGAGLEVSIENHRRELNRNWDREPFFMGCPRPTRRGSSAGPEMFEEMFQSIASVIFGTPQNDWVWVTGLPGAGKRLFYGIADNLASSNCPLSFGDHKAHVIAVTWNDYGKDGTLAKEEVLKEIRRATEERGIKIDDAVIFAYDYAAHQTPVDELMDKARPVQELLLDSQFQGVVYIHSFVDCQFDLNARRPGGRVISNVDADVVKALAERYHLPLRPKSIRNLSGHFRGYAEILYSHAQDSFVGKPGTTMVTEELEHEMIELSLRSEALQTEADALIQRVKKVYGDGGAQVCDHLRVAVREHMDAEIDRPIWMSRSKVTVDLRPLLNGTSDPVVRDQAEKAIAVLTHHRVVARQGTDYKIEVLAPFLGGPEVEARYYLAFSATRIDFATALNEAIRREAKRQGMWVKAWFYPERREAGELDQEMMDGLRESANLVVVFDTPQFDATGLVRGEVVHWKDLRKKDLKRKGLPDQRELIALSLGGSASPILLNGPIMIAVPDDWRNQIDDIANRCLRAMKFLPPNPRQFGLAEPPQPQPGQVESDPRINVQGDGE